MTKFVEQTRRAQQLFFFKNAASFGVAYAAMNEECLVTGGVGSRMSVCYFKLSHEKEQFVDKGSVEGTDFPRCKSMH